jgi:chemotaxis signal transduction protein
LTALAFRSDGRRWCVPVSEVREAARVPPLTPLPGASRRCAGVALVRGEPLAVVHAGERTPDAAEARLLLFYGRPFALLVDGVDGVEDDPKDATPLDLDALERET